MPTYLSGFPSLIKVRSSTTFNASNEGNCIILADASGSSLTLTLTRLIQGNFYCIIKSDGTSNPVHLDGLLSGSLTTPFTAKLLLPTPNGVVDLLQSTDGGGSPSEDRKVAAPFPHTRLAPVTPYANGTYLTTWYMPHFNRNVMHFGSVLTGTSPYNYQSSTNFKLMHFMRFSSTAPFSSIYHSLSGVAYRLLAEFTNPY